MFGIQDQPFLEELIQYHLNIAPEKLKANQLTKITDWLEIATHMLGYNDQTINSYMAKVRRLSRSSHG